MTTARLLMAAGAALAGLAGQPARAGIATADQCASAPSQAEEVACLRRALEESRAALSRAQGERKAPARTADVARQVPRGEQMGAEQVATRGRAPRTARPKAEVERTRALATAVATDHLGLVTLRLDNGQVWRQAESGGVPLQLAARRAYPVEITRSGFGGYRMRFADAGRQIVVKRVQ